jgi:hypothetical protein
VAGWTYGGVVVEGAELSVTFADSDVPATAIFAPLGYVTWRRHWFDHANAVVGTPADHLNEAVSGPAADPDGDGATNFAEFAFGGDPYVADVAELAAGVAEEGGALTLTYRQPASSEVGVHYQLMGSMDMRVWEPVDMVMVARVLDDSGYWRVTVREDTTRDGGAHLFLRMEATTKP